MVVNLQESIRQKGTALTQLMFLDEVCIACNSWFLLLYFLFLCPLLLTTTYQPSDLGEARIYSPRGHINFSLGYRRPEGVKYTIIGLLAPILDHPMIFDFVEGGATAEHYREFFTYFVPDVLQKDQILFVDNLSFHVKGEAAEFAREVVRDFGAHYLPLPKQSPEFNVIELVWLWLKNKLHNVPLEDDLLESALKLLSSLRMEDCVGFFHEMNWV